MINFAATCSLFFTALGVAGQAEQKERETLSMCHRLGLCRPLVSTTVVESQCFVLRSSSEQNRKTEAAMTRSPLVPLGCKVLLQLYELSTRGLGARGQPQP